VESSTARTGNSDGVMPTSRTLRRKQRH